MKSNGEERDQRVKETERKTDKHPTYEYGRGQGNIEILTVNLFS